MPSYIIIDCAFPYETERNANGKIMKDSVRKRVRKEWARRLKEKATAHSKNPKAKL